MKALRRGLAEAALRARMAPMLFSPRRVPWPEGWPKWYVRIWTALALVAAALAVLLTAESPFGAMVIVPAWTAFENAEDERLAAYVAAVSDATDFWRDPYEKAAIKLAVASPGLSLDRALYEAGLAARGTVLFGPEAGRSLDADMYYCACSLFAKRALLIAARRAAEGAKR